MSEDGDDDHDVPHDDAIAHPAEQAKDPYGVLNLATHASLDDIQRSYKHLSRAFHPDKQPPGPKREEAQTAFVEFKVAHDILTDPVLRQAYDDHGHYGVYFVKRSMNSTDENSTFNKMVILHKLGKKQDARQILDEAIQYNEYEVMTSEIDASGSIEIKCSMLHTAFLNEGAEAMGIPEVEKASMAFSVGTSQGDGKWSATFGASSNVRNGEASGSGSISVGYNPVQGTDISVDVDVGEDAKVSISTSRVLSSRTLVNTGISTLPGSDKLALSLSSHRPLFQNKIRGTWAIGMSSPDFSLHYGLLSFTSLDTKPRYTAKLNVGVDRYPLRITADHKFTDSHLGQLSYGWGPSGVELSGIMSRVVSKYAKFSIGVRHIATSGLTWLLKFQRGQFAFSVPITVSSITSPGYSFKCLYMTFLSLLIDEAIGDLVSEATSRLVDDRGEESKAALRSEEAQLVERSKARADAKQQVELMKKPAQLKREEEMKKNGLVIIKATYEVEDGDVLEVTDQLQFWVANSSLNLPSTPKSNLLGFYDVRRVLPVDDICASATFGWRKILARFTWGLIDLPPAITKGPVPVLTVRYKFQDGVYEIRSLDDDPLSIPSPAALKMGDSRYVK